MQVGAHTGCVCMNVLKVVTRSLLTPSQLGTDGLRLWPERQRQGQDLAPSKAPGLLTAPTLCLSFVIWMLKGLWIKRSRLG